MSAEVHSLLAVRQSTMLSTTDNVVVCIRCKSSSLLRGGIVRRSSRRRATGVVPDCSRTAPDHLSPDTDTTCHSSIRFSNNCCFNSSSNQTSRLEKAYCDSSADLADLDDRSLLSFRGSKNLERTADDCNFKLFLSLMKEFVFAARKCDRL